MSHIRRGPMPSIEYGAEFTRSELAAMVGKTKQDERKRYKQRKRSLKLTRIAILDMETDPFDKDKPQAKIEPFLSVLYREDAEPIVIWENDLDLFVSRTISAIESLPGEYTIYAHNGGKFDFMFLIHKFRGDISFKGRGIMVARIGAHELRDSFHIIPERLANWKKDDFDYSKLARRNRKRFREEIIRYCINDCAYLLDIVKSFVGTYGLKLSIGQAAISELRKHYNVKRISEQRDDELRNYFFGGRVECLAGKGHFRGHYKLYDVNSMYPAVMADCQHPIGNEYAPRRGAPNAYTCFVNVTCRNYGAFVGRTKTGETTALTERDTFFVSIHEWRTALAHNLIDDVKINYCIDCNEFSTFEKFVHPLYANRLQTKALLATLQPGTAVYDNTKKDDIFYKLLLNNCYGKFAQNPRRFRETWITDLGERPDNDDDDNPWGALPKFETDTYAMWERESKPWRFFNVGTGASITGAARAVLMEAIENAIDPIYCDTDSLICRELKNTEIHKTKLGAWDLEAEFSEVIIAGKKLYACRDYYDANKFKIKNKGIPNGALKWEDMEKLLNDQIDEELRHIDVLNRAPTLTKRGTQHYITRRVRATAPQFAQPDFFQRRKLSHVR